MFKTLSQRAVPQITNYSLEQKQAPDTLNILTLNIAHGRGLSAHQLFLNTSQIRNNLKTITQLLQRESPDLVALQEVDISSIWNGSFNQADYLALHCQHACSLVGAHMQSLKLCYGTAILSKFQLSNPLSQRFSSTRLLPPKGFVIATVYLGLDRNIAVDVVSLHLDFAFAHNRRKQIELVIEELLQRGNPCIVMGDFNCEWTEQNSALRFICKKLDLHTYAPDSSNLTSFPLRQKRWDWLLVSKEFKIEEFVVLDDLLSDHLAVRANVKFVR